MGRIVIRLVQQGLSIRLLSNGEGARLMRGILNFLIIMIFVIDAVFFSYLSDVLLLCYWLKK